MVKKTIMVAVLLAYTALTLYVVTAPPGTFPYLDESWQRIISAWQRAF
jgi:hypothetical protein